MRPKEAQREADEAVAKFAHTDGDHLTLLNAYHAYKSKGDDSNWCWNNFISYRAMQNADRVRSQLHRIMGRLGLPLVSITKHLQNWMSQGQTARPSQRQKERPGLPPNSKSSFR
jgi:HrpA-like RNA helicase